MASEPHIVIIGFLSTFALASLALPISITWLKRRAVLDFPSDRSSHDSPTPRGAGPALLTAVLAGLVITGSAFGWLIVLLVGFTALGFWDDVRQRSPLTRLALQVVISVGAALAFEAQGTETTWLIFFFTIIVLVIVNATNFMDGINGITGLHAVLWGATYSVISYQIDSLEFLPLSLFLIAIGLAFLPWNFPKARLFLGDSGSYLIGGITAVLVIHIALTGQWIAAFAPLMIYLIDTGNVIARRIRKGQSLRVPHREHTYQRLSRGVGQSPRISLVVLGFSTLAAALAIFSLSQPPSRQWLLVTFLLILALLYLATPRLSVEKESSNDG